MIYYLITFFLVTYLFIKICVYEKNMLNVMAYKYFTYGILMVFLYTIKLGFIKKYFEIENGDLMVIVYFTLFFCGSYYIITNVKSISVKNLKISMPSNFVLYTCIFIFIAIIIKNVNVIFLAINNPRMFYANNRIGGGFIYYIIIPFVELLYFILITKTSVGINNKYKTFKMLIITVIFFAFIYIWGQKLALFKMAFIILTSYYYQNYNKNKINRKIVKYIIILGCMLIFITNLYFVQQRISSEKLLLKIVNYSDYLSNFSDLVKYLPNHFWGKIFIEDEFLSYIPRKLWSDKPELFGSLKLGLYIPRLIEWTKAKTGAPSFGPLGQVYADFGLFGIILKLIIEWSFVWISTTYNHKLKLYGYNFFYHWIMLTFCGINIFYITLTTFPIYQILVIYGVYQLSKIKLKK